MKEQLMKSVLLGFLCAGLCLSAWAGPEKADNPDASRPTQPDRIAYLGVVARPVEPSLAWHLALPEGVGLDVADIMPGSAVAGVLEPRDILVRLDDQHVTSPEHLVILVRMRKPGDEVTLSFIRRGREQEARVRLGETERRPLPRDLQRPPRPDAEPGSGKWDDTFQDLMDQVDRIRKSFSSPPPAPVRMSSSAILVRDQDGVKVTITRTDADLSARVEKEGQKVFEGNVGSDDALQRVPEAHRDTVRELIGQLEQEAPAPAPPKPAPAPGGMPGGVL
jgi:hypothetical protein